jgi:hypothetical protein
VQHWDVGAVVVVLGVIGWGSFADWLRARRRSRRASRADVEYLEALRRIHEREVPR